MTSTPRGPRSTKSPTGCVSGQEMDDVSVIGCCVD